MIEYYGVREGKTPGVYSSWKECSQQVKGFKRAVYKKFNNLYEAEQFVMPVIKNLDSAAIQKSSCVICRKTIINSTRILECNNKCETFFHLGCIEERYVIKKEDVADFCAGFICYVCSFKTSKNGKLRENVAKGSAQFVDKLVENQAAEEVYDEEKIQKGDQSCVGIRVDKSEYIRLNERDDKYNKNHPVGGKGKDRAEMREENNVSTRYENEDILGLNDGDDSCLKILESMIKSKSPSIETRENYNWNKKKQNFSINEQQPDSLLRMQKSENLVKDDGFANFRLRDILKTKKQYQTKYFYNSNRLNKVKYFYLGNLDSDWSTNKVVNFLKLNLNDIPFNCYKLKSTNKAKSSFCIESKSLSLAILRNIKDWPSNYKIRIFGGILDKNEIVRDFSGDISDLCSKNGLEMGETTIKSTSELNLSDSFVESINIDYINGCSGDGKEQALTILNNSGTENEVVTSDCVLKNFNPNNIEKVKQSYSRKIDIRSNNIVKGRDIFSLNLDNDNYMCNLFMNGNQKLCCITFFWFGQRSLDNLSFEWLCWISGFNIKSFKNLDLKQSIKVYMNDKNRQFAVGDRHNLIGQFNLLDNCQENKIDDLNNLSVNDLNLNIDLYKGGRNEVKSCSVDHFSQVQLKQSIQENIYCSNISRNNSNCVINIIETEKETGIRGKVEEVKSQFSSFDNLRLDNCAIPNQIIGQVKFSSFGRKIKPSKKHI